MTTKQQPATPPSSVGSDRYPRNAMRLLHQRLRDAGYAVGLTSDRKVLVGRSVLVEFARGSGGDWYLWIEPRRTRSPGTTASFEPIRIGPILDDAAFASVCTAERCIRSVELAPRAPEQSA